MKECTFKPDTKPSAAMAPDSNKIPFGGVDSNGGNLTGRKKYEELYGLAKK